MSEPKILLFDIESSHLKAPFAILFCIGWKWHGDKKIHIIRVGYDKNGFLDDRNVIEEFAKVWNECDYACGHYAQRFDWRMINTKTAKYHLPALSPKKLIDTWRVAKDNFAMHSNRLVALQEYFEVANNKTPLTPQVWQRASQGCKKSLKYIIEHCVADVAVLEDVFNVMRPWIKEPARSLFLKQDVHSCEKCGSSKLQRRGVAITLTSVYPRFQCQSCGHWGRGTKRERSAGMAA